MNKRRNIWIRIVLPLLVTAAIFLIFFQKTSLADIRKAFSSLSLVVLLFYIFLSLAGTCVRMLRFSLLLSQRIPQKKLFLITLVHNFSVDLLPARTAALGFYSYFAHREGVDWEDGAASFVSAVVYDVLAVGILLIPAIFLVSGGGVNAWGMGIALFFLILVSIAFLLWAPSLLGFFGRRIGERHPKVASVARKTEAYFRQHEKGSERLLLLGLSFLIKLIKYLSVYVLITALVPSTSHLRSFFTFSFGVAAAEVSAYLPIQGIAGFGTWEAAFAFAVSQLHLAIDQPFVIALAVHLTTQVWEYGIGLLAFLYLLVRKKKSDQRHE